MYYHQRSIWDDWKDWYTALIIFFVITLLGGCVYVGTYREKHIARVSAIQYDHRVDIQVYAEVQDGGWSVEPGGRVYNSYSKVHHYDRVKTGESCTTVNKRRSCSSTYTSYPVYRTWYEYKIDRWIYEKDRRTSGHDQYIKWPDMQDIRDCSHPLKYGCEKIGMKYTRYQVAFDNHATDMVYNVWCTYKVEDKVEYELEYELDYFNRVVSVRHV